MALSLSLTKTITDYSVLTLIDNTGAYDVSTNPTGWGAPNIALSAVQYAHLLITTPSNTVAVDVDIISDLGINFATVTDEELIYNVTNDLLGGTLGSTIDDGLYTVEYRISTDASWVEDAATNYTVTVQLGTYYQVQAAVFENVSTIPTFYSCSKCCSLQLKDIVTQFMLLQALIYASDYAYLTEFSNILTTLEQVLSFSTDLICNC